MGGLLGIELLCVTQKRKFNLACTILINTQKSGHIHTCYVQLFLLGFFFGVTSVDMNWLLRIYKYCTHKLDISIFIGVSCQQ